jgi:putative tryptophan/tyrosine transport system substrate-binding protein
MDRRRFIGLFSAMAAVGPVGAPVAARAQPAGTQQAGAVKRVGVLMSAVENDPGGLAEMGALLAGLGEAGWSESRNIHVDFRWPGGDLDRVQALATELVALKPDVLVSRSSPTTAALKRAAGSTPIVFVNITEPVEQGFVASLGHPGGTLTGFTNFEGMIGGKWLQLLKEVDPRIARVGVIFNPQTAPFAGLFLRSVEAAAPGLGVTATAMPVASEAEIEQAMSAFARTPGGGLVAIPDSFTGEHRDLLIAQAARTRLPVLFANLTSVPSGGLMAYAVDTRDLMHRAAGYVDRILKGEKPAELPVQQPAQFQFSINLKTARALGLAVPQSLLTIADEVIE